jgi:MFS family permease
MATWGLPFILGLALLDRTLTGTQLGVLLAVRTVGYLAAVPVGGVLADRHPTRRVIRAAGLAAAAGVPLIAAGLGRSGPLAAAGAALAGAGHGASRPAFQAFVTEVVEPLRLQEANAAITLAVQGTALGPPAVAALASAFVGPRVLLLGTAALWAAAAALPPPGRPSGARGPSGARRRSGERRSPGARRRRAALSSYASDLLAGAREARRHPWFLAGLGALTTVVATGFAATSVALPLVSRDRYGSEGVLAAATTAYTVGALAGAFVMARWRPGSLGRVALAGLASYALAPLALLLPVHPAAVVAAYVVAGVGVEVFNVPWFTATQREVAPDLLARVSALDFLVTYGLSPLGLAVIAPAIDAFGAPGVLAGCAAACVLAPAAAALVPSSRCFSTGSGTDRAALPTTDVSSG